MIALTFVLRRKAGISLEAFQDYWLTRHGPLVASVREPLRIKRYVQLHSSDPEASEQVRASRGAPEPFDGVARLYWDSFEDLAASRSDPRATDAAKRLLEDERRFIDHARSPIWWGEERVIF